MGHKGSASPKYRSKPAVCMSLRAFWRPAREFLRQTAGMNRQLSGKRHLEHKPLEARDIYNR